MISGLGSSQSAHYAQYAAMMHKIDANNDGQVSKSEFVDAAPQGVSADAASSLFDLLDPQKTGSLNDSDIANAFMQLSAAAKYLLIQQQGGAHGQDGQGPDGQDRAANLFSKLDTNGDGKLTRDEFVAGRPKGMSEEDAGKMYDAIASDSGATDATANGLTVDQFAKGLDVQQAAEGGRHSHRHHGGHDRHDPAQVFDAIDSNQDGVVSLDEFLAGKPDDMSKDDATALFSQLTGGNTDSSLTKDQFVQGMQAKQSKSDPREMLKQLLATLQSQSTDGSTGAQSLDQLMQAINAYRAAGAQTISNGLTAAAA